MKAMCAHEKDLSLDLWWREVNEHGVAISLIEVLREACDELSQPSPEHRFLQELIDTLRT